MATYSNIGIKLITTGDESGTWGNTTNSNFSDILDEAIAGAVIYNIASDADVTLTVSDGSSSDARHAVIKFTSTTLSATRTVTFAPSSLQKTWLVINSTSGGQSLIFKQGSAGATVTVPNGESAIIYSDGAGATNGAIAKALDSFTNAKITTTTLNAATVDLTNLEVTNLKAKDGTAAATIADSTGKITVSTELAVDNLNLSGNAITSTNSNGDIDLTPNGTGEVNITKVDIDSGAIDGTPIGASSASTGAFSTLAASGNVGFDGGTFTFNDSGADRDFRVEGDTDANLFFSDASTDRIGIGTNTPTTKLDVNGTVTATAANVATVNVTTLDATNVEVTNVKAKDGTAAATIADSTGVVTVSAAPVLSALTASQAVFTTSGKALVSNAITGTGNVVMSASPTLTGTIGAAAQTLSGNLTLSGGTANGVLYLNASKVATSGSALTYDGSIFSVNNAGAVPSTTIPAQFNNGGAFLRISVTSASSGSSLADIYSHSGGGGNVSSSAMSFSVRNAGTTIETMRITSAGDVGIGTSSPGALLDISSTSSGASVTNLIVRNNAATATGSAARIVLTATATASRNSYIESVIPTGNAHDLVFATNSNASNPSERMRILGTGGIVFGNGNAEATPTNGLLRGTDGSGTDITGATLTIQGGRGTGSGAGGPIVFSTSAAGASGTTLRTATERMRITSAGELLVGGTTSIQAALGVITAQTSGGGYFNSFRNDTSIVTGNDFGGLWWYGNDTTSNTPTAHAWVQAIASGTHAAGDNPTDIAFATTPDNTETVAEAGRITQAGSYVLKGGTTTAAAGVGIIFPATQVASANANSLDDYEEGVWTPTVEGSTTAGTYTTTSVTATYTKVGRLVTARFDMSFSAASGGSGYILIGGLPFNYKADAALTGSGFAVSLNTSASSSNGITVTNTTGSSASTVFLALTIDNAPLEAISIGGVSTSTRLVFSFSYEVS
jgi:hypothetical protein